MVTITYTTILHTQHMQRKFQPQLSHTETHTSQQAPGHPPRSVLRIFLTQSSTRGGTSAWLLSFSCPTSRDRRSSTRSQRGRKNSTSACRARYLARFLLFLERPPAYREAVFTGTSKDVETYIANSSREDKLSERVQKWDPAGD